MEESANALRAPPGQRTATVIQLCILIFLLGARDLFGLLAYTSTDRSLSFPASSPSSVMNQF
jgi:hypothetical protein